MTKALPCAVKTLGSTGAALLAFCLALPACNAVFVNEASRRAVPGGEKIQQELSGYYLTLEIAQRYPGMMVVIPPAEWTTAWSELSPQELAAVLRELAQKVDLAKYKNHPVDQSKSRPYEKSTVSAATYLRTKSWPEEELRSTLKALGKLPPSSEPGQNGGHSQLV